jgi:hypothetical protein
MNIASRLNAVEHQLAASDPERAVAGIPADWLVDGPPNEITDGERRTLVELAAMDAMVPASD